jgi:hypothetical protein
LHLRGEERLYDRGVIKPRKPSPTESPLRFEIDPERLAERLTAWGGVPLVVQAFRSLGVPASVQRHVHIKQREWGYDEATTVESFVVLNALGGECLEDFTHLREDGGLKEMLGHEIPSPETGRQFLYQFHAEEKIEEAKQRRGGGANRVYSGRERRVSRTGGGEPGTGAGVGKALPGSAHS